MPTQSKRVKRLLREQAALAHEEELRRALLPLAEAFEQWRRGELDSAELSERIHQFHHGEAREIWKFYNYADLLWSVARAVSTGILDREQIPPALWEHLRPVLDSLPERNR